MKKLRINKKNKLKILIAFLFSFISTTFLITGCVEQKTNPKKTQEVTKKEEQNKSKIDSFVNNKKEIEEIKEKRRNFLRNEKKVVELLKKNKDFFEFFSSFEEFQKIIEKNSLNYLKIKYSEDFSPIESPYFNDPLGEKWTLRETKKWLKSIEDDPSLLNDKDFILYSTSKPFLKKDENIKKLIIASAEKYYNDKEFKLRFLIDSLSGRQRAPFIDFSLFTDKNESHLAYVILNEPLYYTNAPNRIKENKKYFLYYLKEWVEDFNLIPDIFKNDKEVVLVAINKNLNPPKKTVESFKDDKAIAVKAIEKNILDYNELNESLRKDKDIILAALNNSESNWSYFPDTAKQDDEIIYNYLLKNKNGFKNINESFFENEKFVLKLLENDFNNIYLLNSKFQQKYLLLYKEIVPKLVYESLKKETKNNKNVVLSFISQNNFSNKYSKLNDDLKYDYEIIKKIVKLNSNEFKNIPGIILEDKQFVYSLININPNILVFLDDEFRDNKQIILKAIKKEPLVFQYASKKLKLEKEVYLFALKNNLKNMEFLPDEILYNKKFVEEYVWKNDLFLTSWIVWTIKKEKELDDLKIFNKSDYDVKG